MNNKFSLLYRVLAFSLSCGTSKPNLQFPGGPINQIYDQGPVLQWILISKVHVLHVGWKVQKLTKELCHSNETWHTLDSSFPDTNCIISIHINPHWMSKSGLRKVVLEEFQNGLEIWWRESCFTRTLNASAHKSVVAVAAVHDCGFELIDHPPYGPYLAPSDYFLFPNMKKHLAEKQYRTDDAVISAVEDFFKNRDESFYTTGIQALQHQWKKN